MRGTSASVSSLLIAIACAASSVASAQDFPAKPLSMIVAQSPGATADLVGRIIAPEMAKLLVQPVVVENKPGADSKIGYEYVAKRVPADGYTMVVVSVSSLAILPVTEKDLRFDPLKDLPPFVGLAEGRYVFGSSAQLPWKTVAELVAHAKANPGKLNAGAASPLTRLLMELLIRDLGLGKVVLVPYSAGGTYLKGLLTAEVQMGLLSEASVQSMEGKFRVLAVTGAERAAAFRDAPTFAELGFPQIPGISFALSVPAGTPGAVSRRLYAVASRALQMPEVKARFAKIGLDVLDKKPDVVAKDLAGEARLYGDIARKAGLQPK